LQKLSVVCPVYNEADIIGEFYIELTNVLANLNNYTYEIIFVVDKCQDQTWHILSNLAQSDGHLKLLLLSKRFGHQMSLVAGVDHSSGDVIIMMDSDLQHPPSLIPAMLGKYESGYDIVFTVRDDSQNIGFIKRNVSKLYYNTFNYFANIEISSSSSDFRLISKEVAEVFRNNIREPNQFLRGLYSWVGFNSTSVNFVTAKREKGKSKYNMRKSLELAISGMLAFSTVPLRFVAVMGVIIALMSFIYSIAIFIKYLLYGIPVQGWISLGMLVSFLGGLQLLAFGVIGEYIGGIFEAVKNRPLYIVESSINI